AAANLPSLRQIPKKRCNRQERSGLCRRVINHHLTSNGECTIAARVRIEKDSVERFPRFSGSAQVSWYTTRMVYHSQHMAEVRLKHGAVSVVGNFRENNEDRFHVDPQSRFFLVADGMGGQCAGEKASELAVELISERLERNLPFNTSDEAKTVSVIDQAV